MAVDLLKVLACAGAVAIVLGRLRMSAIPGYLIAGAMIGPYALGLIDSDERIQGIADLAIVLLMFGIGLHLDVAGMRRGALPLILLGVGSTALSALLIWPVGVVFGVPWASALAIAMAMSMSSTAVVLRVIQSRRELGRAYGRLSFGVLLIQDLIVIGMLAFLPTLAGLGGVIPEGEASESDLLEVIGGTMLRVGGVAAMLVIGKLALPRLMIEASKKSSPEVVLVVAAAVALGAAVAAGALGLSPALGSFLAGFLLASTPFRFQVSGQVTPLRDLFMAVFFTAVGLQVDLATIGPLAWAVVLATAAVVVLKAAAIGGTAWAVGASPGPAAQTGLSLSQAGEFTLVVLGAAATLGLVAGSALSVSIAVVVVSLIATPGLMAVARGADRRAAGLRVAPWVRDAAFADTPRPETEPDGPSMSRHPAVVAGYGPVGRAVADKLVGEGVPVTIIELNTKTVRAQRGLGRSIVYGDVTNPEVLESAGVAEADAVLLTIPDEDAMLRACKAVRAINENVFIAARAGVLSRGLMAKELGADHVTVEELATADAMANQVLEQLKARVGMEALAQTPHTAMLEVQAEGPERAVERKGPDACGPEGGET